MDLSVVIPVSDDEKIDACLGSVNEKVEVIVVMNLPSNSVKKIINKWKKKSNVFSLKIFEIKDRNVSKARNFGVRRSKHDKILFIDSDCVLDENCLRIMDKKLNEFEVVKGGVIFGDENQPILKIDYFTPNLGMIKDSFESLGGFDESMKYTEDYDLSIRIRNNNLKRVQTSEAFVLHPVDSILDCNKRFMRFGIGYAKIDRKYNNFHCLYRCFDALTIDKIFMKESLKNKIIRLTAMPLRLVCYFYSHIKERVASGK